MIEAAREAFAGGGPVTLEAVAARAGVGIGTLYRHFPRREALVEAVYRDQIAELRTGAESLLAELAPAAALRAWMDLFASWAAAKRGMVETLATMRETGAMDFDASRREIEAVIAAMVAAGVEAGELRADLDPADVRTMLAGVLAVAADPDQVDRLLDLTMDAVRVGPPPRRGSTGARPRRGRLDR